MEENNFNNNVSEEDVVTPEVVETAPVAEAPMPEAKVEETAEDNSVESSVNESEPTTDAITTSDFSKSSSEEVQALGSVADGVIGAVKTPKTAKKPTLKPKKTSNKTVAVYSTKNVSWSGVGKVSRGYNIVTQAEADKWSTRDHIRIATPEEVAREFGR